MSPAISVRSEVSHSANSTSRPSANSRRRGSIFGFSSGSGQGILLSLVGTLVFCLGNVVSGRTQAEDIPVVPSTGYAMAYGALLVTPFAIVFGDGAVFEPTREYMDSLLCLAVFVSVIGFGAYLTLLGRIGGERAAYATVLFPVVALLLSMAFEGFRWSVRDLVGVALLVGNAVVLTRPGLLRRRSAATAESVAEGRCTAAEPQR
jgi:drug/metabolite transporter (DMT)-like permease